MLRRFGTVALSAVLMATLLAGPGRATDGNPGADAGVSRLDALRHLLDSQIETLAAHDGRTVEGRVSDLGARLHNDGQPTQEVTVAADSCYSRTFTDPMDVPYLDAIGYGADFSCTDGVWVVAVLTADSWSSSALDLVYADFETDGRSGNGCEGADYVAVGIYDAGLTAGVIKTPSCDSNMWSFAGPAAIDRGGYTDFVAMAFPHGTIGSPGAVTYSMGIASTYSEYLDRLPNSGRHAASGLQPASSPPPAPRPPVTARPTDDSCPAGLVPEDGFTDVPDDNVHEATVDCLVWWRVANGLSATTYKPGAYVNRGQMASFIARLIQESGGTLPDPAPDAFDDDNGLAHERNINRLAAIGVVAGGTDGLYRPAQRVSRAQMATFLVRAYEYRNGASLPAGLDYFADDDGSTHEANINKAAKAGFTGGMSDGSYGASESVRRDQMASFLSRVLDLLVEDGLTVTPDAR